MKTVLQRYEYYRELIRRLGAIPLNVEPKAKELGLNTAVRQVAYREMEHWEFNGSAVDFIAWAGGMFILEMWAWDLDKLEHWPPTKEEYLEVINRVMEANPLEAMVLLRAARLFTVRHVHLVDFADFDVRNKKDILTDMILELDNLRLLIKSCLNGEYKPERITQMIVNRGYPVIPRLVFKNQSVKCGIDSSSKPPTPQPPTKKTKQTKTTHQLADSSAERSGAQSKSRRPSKPTSPA